MPKITAKGPSYAEQIPAPDAVEAPAIVVDEHGDDAAAVADAPAPAPKPAASKRSR